MGQVCCSRRAPTSPPQDRAALRREAALQAAQRRAEGAGASVASRAAASSAPAPLEASDGAPFALQAHQASTRAADTSTGQSQGISGEASCPGQTTLRAREPAARSAAMARQTQDSEQTPSASSSGQAGGAAQEARPRELSRAAILARHAQSSAGEAARRRIEEAAAVAQSAEEMRRVLSEGGLRETLRRFTVGTAEGPRRSYINHEDFGQGYWDAGHLMDHAGFCHDFGFWASAEQRPGTKRIAVGIAGGRVTVGQPRCLVNPSDRSQAAWDAGEMVDAKGFTPQLAFWAFASPLPGMVRISVYEAYEGLAASLLLRARATDGSQDSAPCQIPGFQLTLEFWAFPDPGPLPVVPPGPGRCSFSRHSGYIPHGGDLLRGYLTVAEAKEKCKQLPRCRGFTFEGEDIIGRRQHVIFKEKWDFGVGAWVSYRCHREGEFDPEFAEAAAAEGKKPEEYEALRGMVCLCEQQAQSCAVLHRVDTLKVAWCGRAQDHTVPQLALAAGLRAFPQAGRSGGAYYVMWHIDFGAVQGVMFDSLHEAEAKFRTLDNGPHAAMFTDANFREIQYYGLRGRRIDDFRSWHRERKAAGEVHVQLLHDDGAPRVGLVAQLAKLARDEAKQLLQAWRAELVPGLLLLLLEAAEPGDAAAALLLLAYCSWRLFDQAVCPVMARRSFDRCLLSLPLPHEQMASAFPSTGSESEHARAAFREWLATYVEAHKEKALVSAFLEPSKLYWRRLVGSGCVQEQDVDAHAANIYAGLVERVLGVRCPLPVSWDDEFAVHGAVEFLKADFLCGALSATARQENFGQSFSKLIRESGEVDGKPRGVPLAGARFIFAGARSPEDVVTRALCPDERGKDERETLEPYLARFVRFFRRDFFLEAACNAALADRAGSGSRKCAEALRQLCREDPSFAESRLGGAELPVCDEELCRQLLWEFDEALFPVSFDAAAAARLFDFAGGVLRTASAAGE